LTPEEAEQRGFRLPAGVAEPPTPERAPPADATPASAPPADATPTPASD
jgi:hypothetical protein